MLTLTAIFLIFFAAGFPAPQSPISIDFIVTTNDGTPIVDLEKMDLAIRIDGRERVIRELSLISIAGDDLRDGSLDLPAPFGTNALTTDGRSLVIAIDEDSFRTGREQPLREAIDKLVARLGPRDRALLVTMPFGTVRVPFTTDHARLRRAVALITGQRNRDETAADMACRTRGVLDAMEGFLAAVGFAEGPTSVVFFTGGMAGPYREVVPSVGHARCELTVEQFARLGRAAGKARANFYVVHPDDMAGAENPLAGIEHLAGVTGGRRLPLSTTGDAAIARVIRETSSHYVADLEPERGDREGRHRQVNIKLSRPDARVSFRPSIAFGPEPRATPPVADATPGGLTARQMLSTTASFPALPLRVAAFSSRGADRKVQVVALAETVDPLVPLASVMAVLVDGRGQVVAQWSAADPTEIPLRGAMFVEPGTYRLRMAATDRAGRGGAADYPFTAGLTHAGPFELSSLVLGISRAGVMVPRLEFGAEPVALASIEFYGQPEGSRLTIGLEVARTLDGQALIKTPLAVERLGDGHYSATGALPIGALPAGDYIVRAIVGIDDRPPTRVVRTLRKVIPGK